MKVLGNHKTASPIPSLKPVVVGSKHLIVLYTKHMTRVKQTHKSSPVQRYVTPVVCFLLMGCDLLLAPHQPDCEFYALQTIGDQRLPVQANGVQFDSAVVRLGDDSLFFDATFMGNVTDTIKGRYTVRDSVYFTPTDGGPTRPYSGTLVDRYLIVPWAEGHFHYFCRG